MITNERLWYKLLTDEKCFGNCINIKEFALRFLVRTFNECSVEARVSSIESIENITGNLKYETSEKVTFISSKIEFHLHMMFSLLFE